MARLPRTVVCVPWWLAIPAAAVWLVIMLAVLVYGVAAMLAVWVYRQGAAAWRSRA